MTHLFTDADNTLWDTNAVFVEAQLALLRGLERRTGLNAPSSHDQGLEFLRTIDQRLARQHPDHLRYPPSLLVSGLLNALRGTSPRQAAEHALRDDVPTDYDTEIDKYLVAIGATPTLRLGVAETFRYTRDHRVQVTVVSEEKRERCVKRLESHGLLDFVDDVISAPKSVELFRGLKARQNSNRCLMVGDQIDRDISPAKRAGFECYLYPSDFTPFWSKRSKAQPQGVITRFDELIPVLA